MQIVSEVSGGVPTRLIVGGVAGLLAAVGLLVTLAGAYAVVEPGERGVYVLLGDIEEQALAPGLHWKNPLATVESINVRQVVYYQESEASSSDLQTIHASIAVNYRPEPAAVWQLYKDVGPDTKNWEEVLLRPAIQEITKAVTAKFTAEELIQRRADAKRGITDQIVERLAREHLIVTEVSITDFGFNRAFNEAIEAKQIAEQKAKQAQNELRKEEIDSQQSVVRAEAAKKATILQAEAEAKRISIVAKAEAEYQIRMGETVTSAGLRLRTIEKWDGVMPRVIGAEDFMLDLNLGATKPVRKAARPAKPASPTSR